LENVKDSNVAVKNDESNKLFSNNLDSAVHTENTSSSADSNSVTSSFGGQMESSASRTETLEEKPKHKSRKHHKGLHHHNKKHRHHKRLQHKKSSKASSVLSKRKLSHLKKHRHAEPKDKKNPSKKVHHHGLFCSHAVIAYVIIFSLLFTQVIIFSVGLVVFYLSDTRVSFTKRKRQIMELVLSKLKEGEEEENSYFIATSSYEKKKNKEVDDDEGLGRSPMLHYLTRKYVVARSRNENNEGLVFDEDKKSIESEKGDDEDEPGTSSTSSSVVAK
jgi:hypothetical protein